MKALLLAVALAALGPAHLHAQGQDEQDEAPAKDQAPEAADETEASEDETAEQQPRYLPAIRQELGAMELSAVCEAPAPARAKCSFRHHGRRTGRELLVHVVYSDETDTVYMYVDDYLRAPPDAPQTPELLRRLMTLNWTELAPKLEWDPVHGQVRMSVLMHTDSNFDRRAFRSLVLTLLAEADRRYPELAPLAAGEAD